MIFNLVASVEYKKLLKLLDSTNMYTRCWNSPRSFIVFRLHSPIYACRDSFNRSTSQGSIFTSDSSLLSLEFVSTNSKLTTYVANNFLHLCQGENFSSQLKQRPLSLRSALSSTINFLMMAEVF